MAKGAERAGRSAVRSPSAKRSAKQRRPTGGGSGARIPPGLTPSRVQSRARIRPSRDRVALSREELELQAQAAGEAAQALEVSRQRYADLYDLAPIGYATLDPNGMIREINLAGAALLGKARAALLGRPLRALVAPADRLKLSQHLSRSRLESDAVSTEVWLLLPGGREAAVQLTSRRVIGLDGKARLLTTLIDLSQERQAQQRAQQERSLLEATLRQAADGVMVCDPGGKPVLVNAAARRSMGLDLEGGPIELSEEVWGRAILPDGSPLPQKRWPISLALRGETTVGCEVHMVRGDGHTYDLQVSAAPVRDGWGQIIAAVATFTDITARKSADVIAAAHRRWDKAMLAIGREAVSGNALDAILQSALDAVAAAAETPVGMIRLVEAETRDLVLAAERNLLPAYREVAARIKWGQYVAGQVAATGSLHVLEDVSSQPGLSRLSKLTDPPICSLIGVPLRAQGEVLGTLALGHPRPRRFGAADAMELLPFADMLAGAIRAEQLRAALRREAGARALLLRELNHRVRNNLAALIGLLHLAADSAGGGAADTLNAVAERVGHLANLHHMVDGKGGEPAELRELVATAAQSVLVPLGEDLKVRWCVDGASVKIPATQVIPVALVLTELFTNCMKHAFRGRSTGSVGVSIRRIGADVSVEVSDDGPGPGSGSGGLGLDISKALVRETLHGSFHLVPARDGGALVCVRFPLRPDLQRQGGEA